VSDTSQAVSSEPEDVEGVGSGAGSAGGHFREEEIVKQKEQDREKSSWWPNCTHPRYTKLAQRKFRDRIVILWKCRRCPRQVREVIDIDMNSREVFVKSTKSALPRRYDGPQD